MCAVAHDLQSTHSRLVSGRGESLAVIVDFDGDAGSIVQTDHDVIGVAVADRIVHRFLSDAVEVRSHVVVHHVHRTITLESR